LEDRYTAVIYFGHRIPVASTNVRLGVAGFAWSSKGLIASQCQVRLAIIFESECCHRSAMQFVQGKVSNQSMH
jgi:hypothetical protein